MGISMTTPKAVPGPSTRAVHAGASGPHAHNAIVHPVVQSATYTFADTQDLTAHQRLGWHNSKQCGAWRCGLPGALICHAAFK